MTVLLPNALCWNFWSRAESFGTPRDDSLDTWSSLWKVALTCSLKKPSSMPM